MTIEKYRCLGCGHYHESIPEKRICEVCGKANVFERDHKPNQELSDTFLKDNIKKKDLNSDFILAGFGIFTIFLFIVGVSIFMSSKVPNKSVFSVKSEKPCETCQPEDWAQYSRVYIDFILNEMRDEIIACVKPECGLLLSKEQALLYWEIEEDGSAKSKITIGDKEGIFEKCLLKAASNLRFKPLPIKQKIEIKTPFYLECSASDEYLFIAPKISIKIKK